MLSIKLEQLSSYTLNFDLTQNHDFTPKSEAINKYINSEIDRIVNESLLSNLDQELISFKPSKDFILRPYFSDVASYEKVGFTGTTRKNIYTDESFYVFDVYDNYTNTNQNLLSRNFVKLTKVYSSTTTDIKFYNKKIVKEFTNIYIPSYFISTTNIYYLKISFFNSLTGDFRFFECSKNELDGLKDYFKIQIDKDKKTFEILNGDVINFGSFGKTYKISQVIESKKEERLFNSNRITKLRKINNNKKIITTSGKII